MTHLAQALLSGAVALLAVAVLVAVAIPKVIVYAPDADVSVSLCPLHAP